MGFDFDTFSLILKTILTLSTIYISFPFIKFSLNHFKDLLFYSNVPGLPLRPFFGNIFELTGDKSVNEMKMNDKMFNYYLLEPWLKTGLLISGGEKWITRRKLLTSSFHFDILKQFLKVMNDQADQLNENLNKLDIKRPVALEKYFKACTLDIICETAMGLSVSAQIAMNSEYVNAIQDMCQVLYYRMKFPWLWSDFIFKYSPSGRKQEKCLKILHSFTKKIINERAEQFQQTFETTNKKQIALLDMLLETHFKDPNVFTLDDIQEEVDTFMFTGHDTISVAIKL